MKVMRHNKIGHQVNKKSNKGRDHSLAWYDASLGRWRSPVRIRLIPPSTF